MRCRRTARRRVRARARRYRAVMHTVPLDPKRMRASLWIGLVLAVVMIVVGIVALAVGGPVWYGWLFLVLGVAILVLSIVRLALLRRT